MFRNTLWGMLLLLAIPSFGAAEELPKGKMETLQEEGYSVQSITPIFSQLLMLSFPKGFKPVFEKTRGIQYIQESVPEGQTRKSWSDMITVSGTKGLASIPNFTPQSLVSKIAAGLQRNCPASFNAIGLGAIKLDGYDAFGAVVGCGVAIDTGLPYSESALIIAIKGENDVYMIQWAERGLASKTPITLDTAKWAKRLMQLAPVKLCPVIPGEQAPFPSCANRK